MRVILSLGTNTDYGNIEIAEKRLMELFSAVRVSRTIISPAVNTPNEVPDFANAVVDGETELSYDEMCAAAKQIEQDLGRRRDGSGNVAMDIDILLYGDQKYKLDDWDREYVKKCCTM